MNHKVLNDVKAVSGFSLSVLLSVFAVILAVYDNSYWVFFVAVSMLVLFLSVFRASKVMKA
ncbi:hypothetical protein EQV77_06150 [Halobacillus fulvus]|nr:hypothetical protein EQV77_06150 [Halobacillus fulvus]